MKVFKCMPPRHGGPYSEIASGRQTCRCGRSRLRGERKRLNDMKKPEPSTSDQLMKAFERKETDLKADKKKGIKEGSPRDEKMDASAMKKKLAR